MSVKSDISMSKVALILYIIDEPIIYSAYIWNAHTKTPLEMYYVFIHPHIQ
jgi:hypothetical protein